MGQTQTSVILKQDALNLTSKSPNKRIIYNGTEINQCLSLTSMLDQLSIQLSSISFKVSSITINPFSYQHITLQLFQKEYLQSKQFQILNNYEFIRNMDHPNLPQEIPLQTKTKGQSTLNQQWNQERLTIDDFDIDYKQGSNSTNKLAQYQQDKNNTKLYQLKEDQFLLQREINNQYKRSNGQQIIIEKTENFSDEEVTQNNSFSISQNFAELKQNQVEIDDKSYLQNNRFWSSDHSSTLIDFQINNQNINFQNNNQSEKYLDEAGPNFKHIYQVQSTSQNPNQRIINQQSFGTIKTVNQIQQQPQLYHLTTSPTAFSQNKLIKQQQPQISQQFPLESHQHLGYTQLHSNKKMNLVNHQINTITPIQQQQNNNNPQANLFMVSSQMKQIQQFKKSNFHHSASPQAQIPQTQVQQKESMRQEFDRLLQNNKEFQQKQKYFKEDNLQNVKSPRLKEKKKDQNQNINKKQIQCQKDDKVPKKQKQIQSQSPIENKGIIKNGIGYVEMNKIKKQYHRSPDQQFDTIKEQIQSNIFNQQKHHKYIQIHHLDLLSFHTQAIQQSKKQNVSNLQTAMTQNVSPSERGVTNRPIIKDIINLNDLSQYQENYINLDQLPTYRETETQKLRKFSD